MPIAKQKEKGAEAREIEIFDLHPNSYQPRRNFDRDKLKSLADSIRAAGGVIQPIVVRPSSRDDRPEKWEIVAGERRWRALRELGYPSAPCWVVRTMSDNMAAQHALLENIDREDLSVMEEATAYKRMQDVFDLKAGEIAEMMGKDRTSIAHLIRLINLPKKIQQYIDEGLLSASHGKELLSLPGNEQIRIANRCIKRGWNVKRLRKVISELLDNEGETDTRPANHSADLQRAAERLEDELHVRCTLEEAAGGQYHLEINMNSGRVASGVFEQVAKIMDEAPGRESESLKVTLKGGKKAFNFLHRFVN